MLASELRYSITKEKFGAYTAYKLCDSKTGEYATILPFLGGSVNELVLNNKGKLVNIIDGYSSIEDVNQNLGSTFKSSNLFPYPNRIADAAYDFEGEMYRLPMNFPDENNAIHGLVFDKEFDVIQEENGALACQLILRYISDGTSEGYPFKFLLEISYRWTEENGFECTTKISNLSDSSIPIGHGWHPYFKAGSESINSLSLQFPATEVLEVDDRNIPTGKSFSYSGFNSLKAVADSQLDHCFRLDSTKEKAEILIVNDENKLAYKIWQTTGIHKYNFLQVYTPPSRTSIAIEPMTCAPNAFNNEDGLIILAPGERISVLWGVSKLT